MGARGVSSALIALEGFWPIFFLAVILKIPVAASLYLVWWAFHAEPELDEAPEEGGDHEFRRWRRQPRRPRDPRRGPHAPDALPLPACPPGGRLRVVSPASARAAAAHARDLP
jgi:hypothetical protein